jgi:hypothetical protein
MIEFLVAGVPLLLLLLAMVQLSLLWAGKGAVDTAAFLEAFRTCRNRPGGSLGSAALTALDVTRDGERGADRASAGDAMCVRLTHGVELVVPWIDRILFHLSPGKKVRLGDRYYLMLQSSRWVTVE